MPRLLEDLIALYHGIQDPDKDRRNQAIALMQQNPQLMQQYKDAYGDNPAALQQLFGQNARWGSNSNASSNLVNQIQSQSYSPERQADLLTQLQNSPLNNIANAGINHIPGLSALSTSQIGPGFANAMSQQPGAAAANNGQTIPGVQSVSQPVQNPNIPPNILALINQNSNPQLPGTQPNQVSNQNQIPSLVNPVLQDMYNTKYGLPTAMDRQAQAMKLGGQQATIENTQQQTKQSAAETANLNAQLPGIVANTTVLQDKASDVAKGDAAKKWLIDNNTDAFSAIKNPNTPQEIKNAISNNDGLSKQVELRSQQQGLELQKYALTPGRLMDAKRADFADTIGKMSGADPQTVMNVMNSYPLQKQLTDPSFTPQNDQQTQMRNAAVALQQYSTKMPQRMINDAMNTFQTQNRFLIDKLFDTNTSPAEAEAIKNQLNGDLSIRFSALGMQPPQLGYGRELDQATGMGTAPWRTRVAGWVSGDPRLNLPLVPGGSKTPTTSKDNTPKTDPTVTTVLTNLNAGTMNWDDVATANSLTPAQKAAILSKRPKK